PTTATSPTGSPTPPTGCPRSTWPRWTAPLGGGAARPARGRGAGGRGDGTGQGVGPRARRAADHDPRGSEPPGAAHVRGRGAPGPPARAHPDRSSRRPPPRTGPVAPTDPGRG